MISFTTGNLLDADVEALVNTVNCVGIMGKGIALMFKEAFPRNFKEYQAACKEQRVEVGRMFITERHALVGPRWIINFPTKKHWKGKTKPEWIESGLEDLRAQVQRLRIRSLALPPLGCGYGGLDWAEVRPMIETALADLEGVSVVVYEPTREYQNISKRDGVENLTPARALVAELIRRYWVLGIECSMLEVQKLAWFLERHINHSGVANPLDLRFEADRYGPYADRLRHLLNSLDGSYLRCEVRVPDAKPSDLIAFNDDKKDFVSAYLKSEAKSYLESLEHVTQTIDGFESPLGMELLATVDWLLSTEACEATVESVREGLGNWPGSPQAGQRKLKLFDDRMLRLALARLTHRPVPATTSLSTASTTLSP